MATTGPDVDLTPAQSRRRRQIVAAAERLFAEGRFDEVLMEQVAREAGVGKGTLYRYFADKESLYFAVVSEGFAAIREQVRCGAEGGDPEERLARCVRVIVHFLSRNRFVFKLMGRDDAEGSRRRGYRQQWARQRGELVDAVAEVLRHGAERGVFDVRHLRTEAQILLGIVRSCLRYNDEGLSPERIVAETMRVFLQGVARRPDPEPATPRGARA